MNTEERLRRRLLAAGLSAFQVTVLLTTRLIRRGTVISYAELARRIGKPRAVRAVGRALGRNPLAPYIPCHRVIRSDGRLGGYAKGPARKRALLIEEQVTVTKDGKVR